MIVLTGSMSVRGQSITNDFSFSEIINVPDGDANGLATSRFLSGMTGTITNVSVTLKISSSLAEPAFNGDLYAYLRGPNDGFAVLLNRTGLTSGNPFGYDETGFDVTFSTSTANNIHLYRNFTYTLNIEGQLTGNWQPDGRMIDPQSSPSLFDSVEPSAMLDSFNGTNPNGNWTLFLADVSSGGKSQLVSWGLQIQTVPEPSSWLLFAMGMASVAKKTLRWKQSRRQSDK